MEKAREGRGLRSVDRRGPGGGIGKGKGSRWVGRVAGGAALMGSRRWMWRWCWRPQWPVRGGAGAQRGRRWGWGAGGLQG